MIPEVRGTTVEKGTVTREVTMTPEELYGLLGTDSGVLASPVTLWKDYDNGNSSTMTMMSTPDMHNSVFSVDTETEQRTAVFRRMNRKIIADRTTTTGSTG